MTDIMTKKCTRCHWNNDDERYKLCQECRDDIRDRKANKKAEVKEGFRCCTGCLRMKEVDKYNKNNKSCIECCNNAKRLRTAKALEILKENGKKCYSCATVKPIDKFKDNNQNCNICMDKGATCTQCHRKHDDQQHKMCQECRDYSQNLKTRLKAEVKEGFRRCPGCLRMKEVDKYNKNNKSCIECCNNVKRLKAIKMSENVKGDERKCYSCVTVKSIEEFSDNNQNCTICTDRAKELKADKLKTNTKDGQKVCSHCAKTKVIEEFRGVDGSECKRCSYCRTLASKYDKQRKKEDERYHTLKLLRARLRDIVENKWSSTKKLLACDIEYLMEWLHYQLEIKYNINKKDKEVTYHLDHFIPCSSFDFRNEEEQKECFHWTNLQWLIDKDNLRKKDKIPSKLEIEQRRKLINNFKER